MNKKTHPTHARTSRIVIGVLLTCIVFAAMAVLYFTDRSGTSAADIYGVSALIGLGAAAMLVLVARAFFCKCPGCGVWLTEQTEADTDNKSRKFACRACDVNWDTKVRLSIGGTG